MTDKPIGNPATNMVHRERRQTDLTPQERKWPESELVKQARRLQAAEAERDRLAVRVAAAERFRDWLKFMPLLQWDGAQEHWDAFVAALAGEDDGPPKPQREGDYL